jgi:multidrug efflux pump
MTSAATICGHFPLTLVRGAGAAARNSIGITVVAGMAIGTIFTLLVIPSIYVLLAKQHAGEAPPAVESDLDDEETEEETGRASESEENTITAFRATPGEQPAT